MTHEEREALHKLYPKLTDEELEAMQENLDRYVEIAWEVMQDKEGLDSGR